MSVVIKTIGKHSYQYEVSWDKDRKKQVWTCIGKIDTNVGQPDVGKQFTNAERKAVDKMLSWIISRKKRQSGCAYRETAIILRKKLVE